MENRTQNIKKQKPKKFETLSTVIKIENEIPNLNLITLYQYCSAYQFSVIFAHQLVAM